MGVRRSKRSVTVEALGAGVWLMTLIGAFHHREPRELERRLRDTLDGGAQHLVVDMRGVEFFSASALRVLVRAALKARERGIGFVIIRPDPDIWEAFELTGLDTQLLNSGSLEAALALLPVD